jgi:hypothetical protein
MKTHTGSTAERATPTYAIGSGTTKLHASWEPHLLRLVNGVLEGKAEALPE